jgi:hypothetical protein
MAKKTEVEVMPVMSSVDWALDGVVTSTKDPTKLSLTVKGLMLQIVPFILLGVGIAGGATVGLEGQLNQIVENASKGVALAVELVSLLMVTWGLIRKVLPF